jgi:hypothetical protein
VPDQNKESKSRRSRGSNSNDANDAEHKDSGPGPDLFFFSRGLDSIGSGDPGPDPDPDPRSKFSSFQDFQVSEFSSFQVFKDPIQQTNP